MFHLILVFVIYIYVYKYKIVTFSKLIIMNVFFHVI